MKNAIRSAGLWLLCTLVVALPAHAQLPDFTALVETVSPAVVNISATHTADAAARGATPSEDEVPEIFRRYFGQPGPQAPRDRVSMGTGFLISVDGYVLTNHHVVDGADEVYVRLADRRELQAKVVGSDEQSDIALLKLEGRSFPTLKLGNSRALKPGQWVVAIGSPFGFDHSVTAGIVSATGRTTPFSGQQYVPFIQTDVAINRGNSGGPLLNTDGEVIGINSQIFSNTGGFMGVSFAIPVEVAMNAVEQLKTKGYVARGLLGVEMQEVTRDVARSLKLPRTGGALVNGFSEGSAAQKAGLQRMDVIVAFNGIEIGSSGDLPPLVGATSPGTKVTLTVFRDGKTLDIPVVVGELPRDALAASAGAGAGQSSADNALGLAVEGLTAEQREALGLGAGEGVVISRVTGIAAQRAGLQPGNVILQINRTPIGSVAAFNDAVKDARPGEPLLMLIRDGDVTQFRTITPAREE